MHTQKQISNAIRRLIYKWEKRGYSRRSINCGNCNNFAEQLLTLLPKGDTFWGNDIPEKFPSDYTHDDMWGHCFFYYNERYYDSECVYGVTSPEQLPYYKRSYKLR